MARRRFHILPGLDGLSLAGAGHDKVLALFQAFERLRLDDDDELEPDIVGQACHELALDGSDEAGCPAQVGEPEPEPAACAAGAPAPSLPAASEPALATTAFPAARAAGLDLHCLAGNPPGRRPPT